MLHNFGSIFLYNLTVDFLLKVWYTLVTVKEERGWEMKASEFIRLYKRIKYHACRRMEDDSAITYTDFYGNQAIEYKNGPIQYSIKHNKKIYSIKRKGS